MFNWRKLARCQTNSQNCISTGHFYQPIPIQNIYISFSYLILFKSIILNIFQPISRSCMRAKTFPPGSFSSFCFTPSYKRANHCALPSAHLSLVRVLRLNNRWPLAALVMTHEPLCWPATAFGLHGQGQWEGETAGKQLPRVVGENQGRFLSGSYKKCRRKVTVLKCGLCFQHVSGAWVTLSGLSGLGKHSVSSSMCFCLNCPPFLVYR